MIAPAPYVAALAICVAARATNGGVSAFAFADHRGGGAAALPLSATVGARTGRDGNDGNTTVAATTSSSTPVPPPPPTSMPVWSLSCPVPSGVGRGGGASRRSSMSVLTFVTPVSVSSPKLWAISLYKTTLTRCSFLGVPAREEEYDEASRDSTNDSRGEGILQLLSPAQSNLVPILGKRTGWDGNVDKRGECAALGSDWADVAGSDGALQFDVLPDCSLYVQVKLRQVTDGGDHDVAICEVTGTGIWDDRKQSVLWLGDDDGPAKRQSSFDTSSALYTGQLRQEGLI